LLGFSKHVILEVRLSNFFKKSRPDAAGALSGLGEVLSQDDIADKEEWFKFKKKEMSTDSEISANETNHVADQELNSKGEDSNTD